MDLPLWTVFCSFLLLVKTTVAVDKDTTCAVCRALVDEVNFEIGKVDPKKKIQVGSFRVDSKGNQGTYEKSYARSEVHLLEIFEKICETFKQYAESENSAGKKSVARIETRQDGKTLALRNVKINPETQKMLKFACEQMVEEHEDEMIALFRKEAFDGIEKAVCGDLTSLCTEEDLAIPMPVTEVDENVEIPNDDDNDDDGGDDVNDDNDDDDTEGMVEEDTEEETETENNNNKKKADKKADDLKVDIKPVNMDDVDPELLQQYLNDMGGGSIPADTVMDKKFSKKDSQKKEEL